MRADQAWLKEPDVQEWLERARLNPIRGLRAHAGEDQVRQASQRYAANIGEALKRLAAIAQQATAWTRPKTQPCQQAMP